MSQMILLAKLLQYGDADRTVSAGAVTERRCRAAKVSSGAVVTLLAEPLQLLAEPLSFYWQSRYNSLRFPM